MKFITLVVKSVRISSIQEEKKSNIKAMARIFGINDRVISWIDVIAWKRLTTSPTTSAVPRRGAMIIMAVWIASWTQNKATSVFISLRFKV